MLENESQAHDKKYCGAKNRAGNPCKRPAGWGTKHPGEGRCKLHGGASTGAPGNINNLKHGLYSKHLAEEERERFEEHLEDDTLDREIALMKVKIERIIGLYPDDVDLLGKAIDMLRKAVLAKHQTKKMEEGVDDPLKELAKVIRESRREE